MLALLDVFPPRFSSVSSHPAPLPSCLILAHSLANILLAVPIPLNHLLPVPAVEPTLDAAEPKRLGAEVVDVDTRRDVWQLEGDFGPGLGRAEVVLLLAGLVVAPGPLVPPGAGDGCERVRVGVDGLACGLDLGDGGVVVLAREGGEEGELGLVAVASAASGGDGREGHGGHGRAGNAVKAKVKM